MNPLHSHHNPQDPRNSRRELISSKSTKKLTAGAVSFLVDFHTDITRITIESIDFGKIDFQLVSIGGEAKERLKVKG